MRVKLPRMSKAEIDQLLSEQFLCRIAFRGKRAPYIAPFQYVFIDGVLYFHFTDYGRKMGLLEEGNAVCVEIERYTPNLRIKRVICEFSPRSWCPKRSWLVCFERGETNHRC